MKFRGITIHKNKTCNTWYARHRVNGRQIYISASTQQDCYNELKLLLKKEDERKYKKMRLSKREETQNKSNITLLEWYNKWLVMYKSEMKETTKLKYKDKMKHLKKLHNIDLCDIKIPMIIEILQSIKSARGKQLMYEFLNDMLQKALDNELIEKNIMKKIEKPKWKSKEKVILSEYDQDNFEKYCSKDIYKLFLICLYQGLRRGEALALTKADFDLKNKKLIINKAFNGLNKISTTKNETSNRVIPLFDTTIKSIDLSKFNDNERIFNITSGQCSTLFEKFKQENNLNQKYTIHSLRHTFITICQEKQIPLHIIQKWVGHTTGSRITNQVYTHTRSEKEKECIEKFNSNSTQ